MPIPDGYNDPILSVRRELKNLRHRLGRFEDEVQRLREIVIGNDGRAGVTSQHCEKLTERVDELEARMTDHETHHRTDARSV